MKKLSFIINAFLVFLILSTTLAQTEEEFQEATKEIRFLNSENFKEKISTGIWMVFFGATWCPHCKHYTPNWLKFQKAVDEKDLKNKYDFDVAKVECTESEDVCQQMHLLGYPTTLLFNNGEQKGEATDRDPEKLMKFAEEKIKIYYEENKKYGYKKLSDEQLSTKLMELLETDLSLEDKKNVNPNGEIVHLTDETFYSAINSARWFVMFHAPWCGHCKNFSPTWVEFASKMKNKLNIGKVDCTQYKEICNQYQVTGYPTLKMIDNIEIIDYKGNRQISDLENFVQNYISSRIEVAKADTIREAMKTNEVVFFHYYSFDNPPVEELKKFINVIISLNVFSAKVYLTPDEELKNSFNIEDGKNGLLVSRDFNRGFFKYEGSYTDETEMKEWIERYKNPFVIEITPINSDVYLKSKSYVVMAILPTSNTENDVYENVKMASRSWAARHEVEPDLKNSEKYVHSDFVWLDGSRYSKYIQKTFGIVQTDLPRIIILHPSDNKYYDIGINNKYIHEENVNIAINAAIQNQLKAKRIRNGYTDIFKQSGNIQIVLFIVVCLLILLTYVVCCVKPKNEEYYLPVKADYTKQA